MNGRRLNSLLARTGMPNSLRLRTIKAAKIAAQPGEWARRRRALRDLPHVDDLALADLKRTGALNLNRLPIPELNTALQACRSIYDDGGGAVAPSEGFNNRNLLSVDHLHTHPEIIALAQNRELVAVISAYLGQVPVIGSVQLWLSQPNPLREGSQLFHLDKVDVRQVKLFLNVLDIESENGPFTFFPADRTAQMRSQLADPFGRVMDEEIEHVLGFQHVARLTGAAGTGSLVDTCRCLHCGSRISAGQRLVLVIQYLPYHCALEPNDKQWRKFAARHAELAIHGKDSSLRGLLISTPS